MKTKLKIDTKKLAKLFRELHGDQTNPKAFLCLSTSVCVGEVDGHQFTIKVSRDEDDQHPIVKRNICINES